MTKPNREPAFLSHEEVQTRQKNQDIAKAMSRNEAFHLGFIRVEDLDDQELQLGRAREYDGQLPRATPKTSMLPRTLYDELVQEHQRRNNEKLRQLQDEAIATMAGIMGDVTAEPRDRFEAAKYIFERTAGKTPDRQHVVIQKQPWEEVFEGIATGPSAQQIANNQPTIVDGQVVQPPAEPLEPSPYGHIQAPTDPTVTQPVPQIQEEENGIPRPEQPAGVEVPVQPVAPMGWSDDSSGGADTSTATTRNIAEPHEKIDLEPQTCPDPPNSNPLIQPHAQAPTWQNPVNTSATMPHPGYFAPVATGDGGVEQIPLSEKLRRDQEAADALRKQRDEARDARKNAKKRRIIQRTLGIDAKSNMDIRATIAGDPENGEVLRFDGGNETG